MIYVKAITADDNEIKKEYSVISKVELVHAGIRREVVLKIWFKPESSKYNQLTVNS